MGQPQIQLWAWAIAELVSSGHWDCLVSSDEEPSQLPYACIIRVSFPPLVVRGGDIFPECGEEGHGPQEQPGP